MKLCPALGAHSGVGMLLGETSVQVVPPAPSMELGVCQLRRHELKG